MNGPGTDDDAKALAGLFQATALVKQLARSGEMDEAAFTASIGSVFYLDAASVDELYGGLGGLRVGLEVMRRQLADARQRDVEVTTYVARVLHLERQLERQADRFAALRTGIAELVGQAQQVGNTHPSVIAHLATLYVTNVSTIAPRIMVSGDPVCLGRDGVPEKIRALLLAALRSSVLWRQLGGRRLRLILGRRRLLDANRRLLALAGSGSGSGDP